MLVKQVQPRTQAIRCSPKIRIMRCSNEEETIVKIIKQIIKAHKSMLNMERFKPTTCLLEPKRIRARSTYLWTILISHHWYILLVIQPKTLLKIVKRKFPSRAETAGPQELSRTNRFKQVLVVTKISPTFPWNELLKPGKIWRIWIWIWT